MIVFVRLRDIRYCASQAQLPAARVTQACQAASRRRGGGARGAELWATDQNNQVWTTDQETAGGGWALWTGPNWNGAAAFVAQLIEQARPGLSGDYDSR